MRKSFLPWLACAVIAVVVVPALAWGAPARDGQSSAPRANAAFVTGDNFFRDVAGAAGDTEVTINPGDTVTFTSPIDDTNTAPHNVDFRDNPPSVCNQTQAPPGVPDLDEDGKSPMPAFTQP